MRFGRILATTLVATSMVVAPIAAQAGTPAQRTGSHVKGEDLHGGFLVPLLALAAVIAGILVLINDKNDTLPHSP